MLSRQFFPPPGASDRPDPRNRMITYLRLSLSSGVPAGPMGMGVISNHPHYRWRKLSERYHQPGEHYRSLVLDLEAFLLTPTTGCWMALSTFLCSLGFCLVTDGR